MGCPGSMIPGFQQSEDIAKQNRGLSTKMTGLVSSEESRPKKIGAAKEVQSFSNLKNNSEIITYHATPSKTIENNKFEIRKPVHGGEGFPRGIHSAPQINNFIIDLNSGEFGNNIFKLSTKVGTVFDLANPDPALIKKLQDSVIEKYSGKVDQTQIEYMLGKIANRQLNAPGLGREFLLENGIDTIKDGVERLISLNPDNIKIIAKVKGDSKIISNEEGKTNKKVGEVLPYVGTNEALKNYIEYVNIDDLQKLFRDYGAQYTKDKWSNLKNDIKSKGGLTEPIIIKVDRKNRTAQISEGHHRITAAKELGYKYLPATVLMPEGSTYAHKRADIIPPADNSLFHPHMIGDELNPNWRPYTGKPSMYLKDLDIR